jgi:hypothetical protein
LKTARPCGISPLSPTKATLAPSVPVRKSGMMTIAISVLTSVRKLTAHNAQTVRGMRDIARAIRGRCISARHALWGFSRRRRECFNCGKTEGELCQARRHRTQYIAEIMQPERDPAERDQQDHKTRAEHGERFRHPIEARPRRMWLSIHKTTWRPWYDRWGSCSC